MASYGVGLYYGASTILASWESSPACEINPVGPGCVTGGSVVNVFFAIIIAAFAIAQAGPNAAAMGAARSAAARIFQIIDRRPTIDNLSEEGLTPATPPRGDIAFENATFAYPSRPDVIALRDFSLTIPAGTKLALVGPSGCGKGTIIVLLQRWYAPQPGRITLNGVDITTLNVQWLRSCMGLVLQETMLLEASVAQNIAYGVGGKLDAAGMAAIMLRRMWLSRPTPTTS